MQQMDRPVKIRECVPLVGTSEPCLRKMVAAGLLPCLRIGIRGRGIRLIPSEVIDAMRRRAAEVGHASR